MKLIDWIVGGLIAFAIIFVMCYLKKRPSKENGCGACCTGCDSENGCESKEVCTACEPLGEAESKSQAVEEKEEAAD